MARWFLILAMSGILVALISILYQNSHSLFGPALPASSINSDENQEKLSKLILYSVSEIQQLWTKGDYKKEIDFANSDCAQLPKNPPAEFLRCNPLFLQCYFSGQLKTFSKERPTTSNQLIIVQENESVTVSKPEFISRAQNQGEFVTPEGIKIEIELNSFKLRYQFVLENLCHETYLPEQVYDYAQTMDHLKRKINANQYEELKKQTLVETPRTWDNIGRFITVDKFLVSVMDFNQYLWELGLEHRMNANKEEWARPVNNISLEEMKSYCISKGKRLLTAPIYDANVFYRKKKSDASGSPFELISRGQLAPELPSVSLNQHDDTYSTDSASWIGTFQWRTQYFEVLDNPWAPLFNLSTYSKLWPAKHGWDYLSYRTSWNGREGELQEVSPRHSVWGELNLFSTEPLDFKKVPLVFRCYREWGDFF